ncbi:DUF6968 family protein [Burkholderia stagnalis]|uniref:DUF6968 family protein n=1 Tax=Burkholderia stagnalis TaxID=1503054 RepID=UPI000F804AC9|nr:hypothetical protein [Burkholderia stagnalis]
MKEFRPASRNFSEIVASRNFEFFKDGISSGILVEIGAPVQDVEAAIGLVWRCPVRITDGKLTKVYCAIGVDSYQSLAGAFPLVRNILGERAADRGGEIRFLESNSPENLYYY